MPTRVGRTSFVYDAAGRVTQTVTKRISKKPLVRSFYYAAGTQPIGFDSSDQPGVGFRYVYDGLKRRVAKETIDTATGDVTNRVVFVHAGNQLVAEHTTLGADHGRGYVWTTDPETGEIIGQTTLTPQTGGTGGTHRGKDYPHGDFPHRDAQRVGVLSWSQDEVDAEFFAIVTDLAGAPHEIIHPDTGNIVGTASQTLYGQRTWRGEQSSPLLFTGQYADMESGWAYNRFRYYNPHAGIYNAQDPLGAPPRLASPQGYVDHAAFWIDVYGLKSYSEQAKRLESNRERGNAARDKFASKIKNSVKEKYFDPGIVGPKGQTGRRFIDVFDPVGGNLAHEIKTGKVTSSAFTRHQVDKDVALVKKDMVNRVMWHGDPELGKGLTGNALRNAQFTRGMRTHLEGAGFTWNTVGKYYQYG